MSFDFDRTRHHVAAINRWLKASYRVLRDAQQWCRRKSQDVAGFEFCGAGYRHELSSVRSEQHFVDRKVVVLRYIRLHVHKVLAGKGWHAVRAHQIDLDQVVVVRKGQTGATSVSEMKLLLRRQVVGYVCRCTTTGVVVQKREFTKGARLKRLWD